MRNLIIAVCYVLVFSCCVGQKSSISEKSHPSISQTYCPEDGICKFEVLTNKSLSLNYDSTGQLYPEIIDSKEIVVVFEYKRNDIPDTQDSHYIEKIYLKLDPNNLTTNIKDSGLKATKAIFARLCFCRGQTGYYEIEKGNLLITKLTQNLYNLKFDFEIDAVPQVIKSISETIQL